MWNIAVTAVTRDSWHAYPSAYVAMFVVTSTWWWPKWPKHVGHEEWHSVLRVSIDLKINTDTYNCHRWIPDSPRWLIVRGLIAEAQLILEEGAAFNRRVILVADIPVLETQKWVWHFADFCKKANMMLSYNVDVIWWQSGSVDKHKPLCMPTSNQAYTTHLCFPNIYLLLFSFCHCFFFLCSAWHPS
jgi:hypothetical protein